MDGNNQPDRMQHQKPRQLTWGPCNWLLGHERETFDDTKDGEYDATLNPSHFSHRKQLDISMEWEIASSIF